MTDQYGVFGNPVAHSKSPLIHAAFAEQTQQNISYDKTLIGLDDFATSAADFFADGGKGLNITVPFKLEAFEYADQLSLRARQAGAVNTLIKQADGGVLGDNTDGIGLVADISNNQQWEIAGARILVLGAGGAVRGVLGPILELEPAAIIIANRTQQKALQLATAFSGLGKVTGVGLANIEGQFDIIINGTSASLGGELPPLAAAILKESTACYDMMYAKEATVFMQWAQSNGCTKTADGLGMLVEQAAKAFELWRHVAPQTKQLIEGLRGGSL